MLSVRKLNFHYRGGNPILRDVSFDAEPGRCVALLGNNGAGKSTLLKCVNRILQADTGSVRLNDTELLALPQRPTAILFPDDFSAIGGIQTIREEGLLIPRDISVAGYDGNLISQIMSPQLTTYRQDTEALGRAAAELLIEQIESPRTALPEQKLISGSLLKGQSVDVPNPSGQTRTDAGHEF